MESVKKKIKILIFLTVLIYARFSGASEWSAEPSLTMKEEVNDNLLMTVSPHSTVWGSTVSPAVKLAAEEANIEINGNASLAVNHYLGEKDLDTLDQSYQISTRFDQTERTNWKLSGIYQVDSTLESELSQTGVVLYRTQRNDGTISVGWSRKVTEKTDFEAGYQFTDIRYADLTAGLYNYRVNSGTAQLSHQVSEKNQINETLFYSFYQMPDLNYLSWDGGIRIGEVYSFTETFKGTFSGGVHRTDSSIRIPGMDFNTLDSGWLLNADLEKQWERTVLHGGFSRETQLSGGGSLVQVDHLFGEVKHKITEQFALSAAGDLYTTVPYRENVTLVNSRYFVIQGGWEWHFSENWELNGGYSYSALNSEAVSQSVISDDTYLKVVYNPPRWSLSR
ncbi:MAG: porin family protein [Nitrospiria bacterium]